MAAHCEIWTNLATSTMADPSAIVQRALRVEADGWDGATLVDSQCLRADVFVVLSACVAATKTLQLGTGTSNPATRHPSVLASAAAALSALSGRRMTLGMGRGDSALAYIGASPMSVKSFETAIAMLQAYLRGEGAPIEQAAALLATDSKGFAKLAVSSAPKESKLKWMDPSAPKVPVEISCTGPKVIGVAARQAEIVAIAVGGDVARMKWAKEEAVHQMEAAGRDPATARFAAYVPTYPHKDMAVSRRLAQGVVASQGRFAVINKSIVGPVTDAQRAVLDRLSNSYDMTHHGSGTASQIKALDEEFIDNFALTGSAERCLDRLAEIREVGFDRLHLWTASDDSPDGKESYDYASAEILAPLKR